MRCFQMEVGLGQGASPGLIQRALQYPEEGGQMARLATCQDGTLGMASTWRVFMTGSYGAPAGLLPRTSFAFASGDYSSLV